MNLSLKLLFAAFFLLAVSKSTYSANTNWTWTGNSSTSWTNKSNWSTSDNDGSPGNGDTVIINSGSPRYPRLGSNRTIARLVLNGGFIDMDEDNLTVREATYLTGGVLDNSDNDEARFRTDDLILDFSGSVTFDDDIEIEIEESALFISGILITANRVEFANDATVSGASDLSFIDGQVRKVGNDAFTFPVGDNGVYAPIAISAPSNSGHHFTAQYFAAGYSDLSVSGLDHVNTTEYWNLDRTNGSSNVFVTLSYSNPRSGQINSLNDLRVARYNGSNFVNHGGVVNGDETSGTVTSSAPVSNFSPFTLGSSSGLNPLPVELISFTASVSPANTGVIEWSTASEMNSAYFQLEKSTDGLNWSKVATITAASNTQTLNEYMYEDRDLNSGVQYYRLRQIDLDGAETISKTISLTFSPKNNTVVNVFPNPAVSHISVQTEDGQDGEVTIRNASGLAVQVSHTMNGTCEMEIYELLSGVYIVEIQTAAGVRYTRFIKQN